jgi:predicted transcriptional regulator
MSTWELFRTLSSKSRLAVIRALGKTPLRYSEILKTSGLNTTDLSRQLSRLIKDSIVEKDSSDRYYLTQFGRLASTSIPMVSFLVDYQGYFNTHDLSVIPPNLIEDIASLRKGNMVSSVYESINLQRNIIPTIRERFWMLTDDLSASWISSTHNLLEHDVDIRAIVTPELAKKLQQEATPLIIEKMHVKTMETVSLVLGYSDKHALICFPNLEGQPDRNHYLFGYDEVFKHWVFHCVRHFWEQAKPFHL